MTPCSPRQQQQHSIAVAILLLLFYFIFFLTTTVLLSSSSSSSSTTTTVPSNNNNNNNNDKSTKFFFFVDSYSQPPQQQQPLTSRSLKDDYWDRKGHPHNNKKDVLLSSSSSSSTSDDNDETENNAIQGDDDEDDNCNVLSKEEEEEDNNNSDDRNAATDHTAGEEQDSSNDEEDGFLLDNDNDNEEDEDDDRLYYDFQEDMNDDHLGDEQSSSSSSSSEAMVVCGVDGIVYTLDAWTGQLRGLFPSGNALVGSSLSMIHTPKDKTNTDNYHTDHDEDEPYYYDDLDNPNNRKQHPPSSSSSSSSFVTERIVPGLDGNLYSLTQIQTASTEGEAEQNLPFHKQQQQQQHQQAHPPKLDILPIRIEDVLQSPVSTCWSPTTTTTTFAPLTQDEEQQACGIVMGQRTTKLFALNVKTGTVQWMQHSAGKDGGFSTHNLLHKNNKNNKMNSNHPHHDPHNPVVLLQREDYVVRHVDMETGEETWKVQLGKFSALDFNSKTSSSQTTTTTTTTTTKDVSISSHKQHPQPPPPPPPHTSSTNVDHDCQTSIPNSIQSRIPNIPNQRNKKKKTMLYNNDNNKRCGNTNHPNKLFAPTHHHETADNNMFVQPMPSIAFRMDGSSFVGLDSTTGEILWKRKIDSIVASAYGVSSTGKWTPLNVIEDFDESKSEEPDIENNNNNKGIFTQDSIMTTSTASYPSLDVNPSSTNKTPIMLQIPLLSTAASTTDDITNKPNEITADPYYDFKKTSSNNDNSIGTESSPLAIINNQNDINHNHQHGSGTDVIAKVGKHSSSFFVFSTIPKLGGNANTKDNNNKNSNNLNSFIFGQPSRDFMDGRKENKVNNPFFTIEQEQIHNHNTNSNIGTTLSSLVHNIDDNPLTLTQLMKKAGVDVSDPKSVTAYLNHLTLKNKKNIRDINGGLFLTWQMVAMLVGILVGMIFCGHIFYQKQKRKWILESTPIQLPTETPNADQQKRVYENGGSLLQQIKSQKNGNNSLNDSPNHLSLSEKNGFPPPLLLEQTAVTVNDDKSESVRQTDFSRKSPVLRSMSLPQLNQYNQSGSSVGESERLHSPADAQSTQSKSSHNSSKNSDDQILLDEPIPCFDASAFIDNIPQLHPITSGTSNIQTNSTRQIANNPVHNSIASSSNNTKGLAPNIIPDKQTSFLETVCNIDGIPLVRYSRYRSEFHEISRLGKGGFGTVFKCTNALDGRQYAIKKVSIKVSNENEHINVPNLTKKFSQKLQRVLREVKILAMLDHKNVVRYYTAWLELDEDEEKDQELQENSTGMCSEDSSSLFNATSKIARGYSSELLAGTGTRSGVTSIFSENSRTSKGGSPSLMQLSKSNNKGFQKNGTKKSATTNALYNNPLGGWNNFYEPTSSLDESCRLVQKENSSQSGGLYNKDLNRSCSSLGSEEDLGFNWERSNSGQFNSLGLQRRNELSTINDSSSSSYSDSDDDSFSSHSDGQWSDADTYGHENVSKDRKLWSALINGNGNVTEEKIHDVSGQSTSAKSKREILSSSQSYDDGSKAEKLLVRNRRHILYMQMELCSQQTLSDFLNKTSERLRSSNKSSRTTEDGISSNDSAIDIPYALRMFSQIAQGVKHVHQQGLIHRDLKPSNCFIDETGTVKIGDFGLSRESATAGLEETGDITEHFINGYNSGDNCLGRGQENTAGVGTRSYASPEQMNGSDYDASTDVYSLGIILFELCYLMSTGMERHLVFKGIRRRSFPDQWHNTVMKDFPSLHTLLMVMLSPNPSERPSSAAVANHIENLLSEYTVLSLDHTKRQDSSVLLRVEAEDNEGILQRTIKMIKEADPNIRILQYGLRGQESKAIMEFALAFCPTDNGSSEQKSKSEQNHFETVTDIFKKLENCKEIIGARQVSEKHMTRQTSIGSSTHSATYKM